MNYNLNWLKEAHNKNNNLNFVYFFGNQQREEGKVDESCMSQWWEGSPFEVEGNTYLTAEHWMMAGKAELFNDQEIKAQILASTTPKEAQELGRKVRNYDSATWKCHRFEIVRDGNIHKFSQHPLLKAYLLSTGDRILVEASPLDKIWGNGFEAAALESQDPNQWSGLNLLGFAIMAARDVLTKE